MDDEGNGVERKHEFLATLPSPWSVGVMADGRVFFVNEETRSTSWLDPRTNTSVNATKERVEGLPLGWEEGVTAEGVYYFIDHSRMKTTFNSPLTGRPKALDIYGSDGSLEASPSPQRVPHMSSTESDGSLRKISMKKQLGILKRDPDASVTLAGWLHKQGSRPPRTWKKRWFVLSEYCLFYYKSPSESHAHASILLPGYEITPVTREDKIGKKFAFKASHAGMRTYYFAADSKETMMKWINNTTLATLMMRDREAKDDVVLIASARESPQFQRRVEHTTTTLEEVSEADNVKEERESPETAMCVIENGPCDVKKNKKSLVKVSSMAKLETVTHSSEMTTTALSSVEDSEEPTESSDEVRELSKKVSSLQEENRQLMEERHYYYNLVQSSKTNLIELKKSMFETLTGLQSELVEEQEANAQLKQRVEELESEIDRTRPLTAMADQMVALGKVVADENETLIKQLEKASESLLLASEKARSGQSQKLLEFSRRLQEEKQQQTQALELREFLMSGEADLETKLTDLGQLEDEMRESSTVVTNLQEEKVELEQQLSEALQMVADQNERDSQQTLLLQTQLTDITQKLAAEEQEMEEKAQENTRLEQEVAALRQRLSTAEEINKTMSQQAGSSDNNKEKLQEELASVQEEFSKVVIEKTKLKRELEVLKGSLLGDTKSVSGASGDLSKESSRSPESSPNMPRRQSEMTRLEMSLELAAVRSKLHEAAVTTEKLTNLKTKLEKEHVERQSSEFGTYSVPKWVQELELRNVGKRRSKKVRDPERLSFREKLEIFLQPQ